MCEYLPCELRGLFQAATSIKNASNWHKAALGTYIPYTRGCTNYPADDGLLSQTRTAISSKDVHTRHWSITSRDVGMNKLRCGNGKIGSMLLLIGSQGCLSWNVGSFPISGRSTGSTSLITP
nr:hypothetical protein CFP56_03379 [Quercus suber]